MQLGFLHRIDLAVEPALKATCTKYQPIVSVTVFMLIRVVVIDRVDCIYIKSFLK